MIEIYELDKSNGDDLARKTRYSKWSHMSFNPQMTNRICCDVNGVKFLFSFRNENGNVESFGRIAGGLIPIKNLNKKLIYKSLDAITDYLKDKNYHSISMTVRKPHKSLSDFADYIWDWFREHNGFYKIGYASVLDVSKTYEELWNNVFPKETRNLVRKAKKNNVETRQIPDLLEFMDDVYECNTSTKVRSGRRMKKYYLDRDAFEKTLKDAKKVFGENVKYYGTFYKGKLIAYMEVIIGPNDAQLSRVLSHVGYWHLVPNHSLFAKVIEDLCSNRSIMEFTYAYTSSLYWSRELDKFKYSLGFEEALTYELLLPMDIHGKIFAFKKVYNLLDGRFLSDLLHHNFTWRRLRNVYRRPYRRAGGISK